MTYRARRVRNGLYAYRQHVIERLDAPEGQRPAWTITQEDENAPCDTASSLREAKAMIDQRKATQ